MASLLAHVAVFAWLVFGLAHVPRLENRTVHQRYAVRILNAPITVPEVRQYAAAGAPVPPAPQPAHAASRSVPAPAPAKPPTPPAPAVAHAAPQTPAPAPPSPPAQEKPAPALPAAIQLAQTVHQSQTLIQPDAPEDPLLQHPTPVPLVMMWTQQNIPPVKAPVITAPPKAIVANMHSSIERPNREPLPAEVNISSTNFHTALPALVPGTTSPIVVRGPDPAKQMPTTAAQTAAPPAPVRIISLSDRQVQEGPVAVPLANASARPSPSQSLTAGTAENSADAGRGGASGKQPAAVPQSTGSAASQSPGSAAGNAPGGNGTLAQAGPAPGAGSGAAPTQPSNAGIGTENPASVARITLPHDGQFGVVVVGSSLANQYPETAAVWNGRLVYTVYLHVGLGKSWILQYSLPPNSQAAASGARPDAPWPYDIVVPKLAPEDYTSDALMVHGYVNPSGRFERMSMVLPAEFAQAKFVLNTLQQWQFRPARQNGQAAQVEILIIIPAPEE